MLIIKGKCYFSIICNLFFEAFENINGSFVSLGVDSIANSSICSKIRINMFVLYFHDTLFDTLSSCLCFRTYVYHKAINNDLSLLAKRYCLRCFLSQILVSFDVISCLNKKGSSSHFLEFRTSRRSITENN